MKYFVFALIFLMTVPAFAQSVDWDKIGRPMGEDTTDLYDRYVYFDEDKTTDTNVPLAEPLLSRQMLSLWAQDNLSQVMTLSAQNYRQEIRERKIYFTQEGLQDYLSFLNEEMIIQTLDQSQGRLSTIVQFTPDILADAVFNGVYRWNIEVPLMLSYQNSNAPQREVTVNIDVVRVPFGQNQDGLAFDHWEIKQVSQLEEELGVENDADLSEGE